MTQIRGGTWIGHPMYIQFAASPITVVSQHVSFFPAHGPHECGSETVDSVQRNDAGYFPPCCCCCCPGRFRRVSLFPIFKVTLPHTSTFTWRSNQIRRWSPNPLRQEFRYLCLRDGYKTFDLPRLPHRRLARKGADSPQVSVSRCQAHRYKA